MPAFFVDFREELNGSMPVSWIPALGSFVALVLSFTVADVSNIRWLGGVVLIVLGGISIYVMNRRGGWLRSAFMLLIVGIAFALSHPLGAVLGSYGSLVLVSLIAAAAIYFLTPRQVRA